MTIHQQPVTNNQSPITNHRILVTGTGEEALLIAALSSGIVTLDCYLSIRQILTDTIPLGYHVAQRTHEKGGSIISRLAYSAFILCSAISLIFTFPQITHASPCVCTLDQAARVYYIDPGTGSIVIQVLIGALVAGAAMIGVYRSRVNMFLRSLFGRPRQEKEGGEGEEPE